MNGTSTTPVLKTELQEEREARDLALYNDFMALTADPAQSKTKVHEYLREKYKLHSNGTTYAIIKRVQERLKNEKR